MELYMAKNKKSVPILGTEILRSLVYALRFGCIKSSSIEPCFKNKRDLC